MSEKTSCFLLWEKSRREGLSVSEKAGKAKMSLCSDCGHSGTILKGDATRVWFVLCCGCGKQVFGDATGPGSAKSKWNEVNIPAWSINNKHISWGDIPDSLKLNTAIELVIIRGLPGSGKSTYAKERFPDYLHYEPDHLFCDTNGVYRFDAQLFDKAKAFVQAMADFALSRGESVVVSDVFAKISELEPYVYIAKYHDVNIRVICREADYGSVHNVSKFVFDEMKAAFEHEGYESVGLVSDGVERY